MIFSTFVFLTRRKRQNSYRKARPRPKSRAKRRAALRCRHLAPWPQFTPGEGWFSISKGSQLIFFRAFLKPTVTTRPVPRKIWDQPFGTDKEIKTAGALIVGGYWVVYFCLRWCINKPLWCKNEPPLWGTPGSRCCDVSL